MIDEIDLEDCVHNWVFCDESEYQTIYECHYCGHLMTEKKIERIKKREWHDSNGNWHLSEMRFYVDGTHTFYHWDDSDIPF